MKKKLKLLLELQICDNRISDILRKKAEGPLRVQKIKEGLAELEERSRESGDRLEELKKERRKLETEAHEFDGKIEKSEIKLSNIKSNKEYAAALKEIEDLKSTRSSVEDRVLQHMEEIEKIEKELLVHKKKAEEAAIEAEKTIQTIKKEEKELNLQLEGLQSRRPHLTEMLDKDLLKTYHLLKERKGGLAVSAVVRGVCQTCHMGFPPQKFNELLKGDAVLTCPHCNRLIYWGEDQDFQGDLAQDSPGTQK